MPTADELLKALIGFGYPVTGINIGDPNDSTTWRIEGKLTPDQLGMATVQLSALLHPFVGPVPIPGPSVDDVITWGAKHFGQTKAEALAEIAALTTVQPPPLTSFL